METIGDNIFKVKLSQGVFARVEKFKDGNRVEVVKSKFGVETVLESFTDRRKIPGAIYNLDRNCFARTKADGTVLIYRLNKLVMSLNQIKTDFIQPLNKQPAPNMKILTMDIETRDIGGKLEPVCISIFNGEKAVNF